jgi:hypothetical protein
LEKKKKFPYTLFAYWPETIPGKDGQDITVCSYAFNKDVERGS